MHPSLNRCDASSFTRHRATHGRICSEPRILDGSYCLFSSPVVGSRQDKIVLVQLIDKIDLESGQRFSVKKYGSKKSSSDEGGWRHIEFTLNPLHSSFSSIVLTCEDEGTVGVVAEFLEVIL